MAPELRATRLLRRLATAEVDFLVIGGVAVIAHGHVRATKDLDIVYASDPENLERLGAVLTELGARLAGVDDDVPFVADARTLRQTSVLTLTTREGQIDLLVDPAGADSYDALASRSEPIDFGDAIVRVVALDDLIEMKRAAGRAQDVADLQVLEAIKRLRRRQR